MVTPPSVIHILVGNASTTVTYEVNRGIKEYQVAGLQLIPRHEVHWLRILNYLSAQLVQNQLFQHRVNLAKCG